MKPNFITADIDQTTASNARWYVTWSAKFFTDGFDHFGGCPPRGSVGISAAAAAAITATTIIAVMIFFISLLLTDLGIGVQFSGSNSR